MDEATSLPIDEPLAPELERDIDFGTGAGEPGAFEARVHNTPIGFRLIDLQVQAKIEMDSKLSLFYDAYDLWLVPHRVSILRRNGSAEPTSVGIEVEYEPEGPTCCIVSLIPSFEYRTHGTAEVGGEFSGAFSASGNTEPAVTAVGDTIPMLGSDQLQLGVSADMRLGFRFKSTVATTKIAAVGVGSTKCEWRIDRDAEPLDGRDIETWAVVAIPSVSTLSDEIGYRIRFYYNARTFLFNTRRQSAWHKVTCRLLKSMTDDERAVWEFLEGGPKRPTEIKAKLGRSLTGDLDGILSSLLSRRLLRRREGELIAQG